MLRPPPTFRPAARLPAVTLVELLVVIGIVGLLAALLFPALKAARERAWSGVCMANLRQIGSGTQMIIVEQDGWLPGSGFLNGNSVAWQDVMNTLAFGKVSRGFLQRQGDTKSNGMIYCPAMRKWGASPGTRYPRAYAINRNLTVTNGPTFSNYSGFDSYTYGPRLASFPRPQKTILVAESERSSDVLAAPTAPYGGLTLGDGTNSPEWATDDQVWAFRHNKQINVVFLDGHVESFTFQDAKKLNDPAYFLPGN